MPYRNLGIRWDVQPAAAVAERRTYPRFPIALAGRCSVGGGPDVACTTIDLSLGGTALRTMAGAAVGERVVVALPPHGIVEGFAVRSTRDGFAVAFIESRPQHRRLTRLLVAHVLDGDALPDGWADDAGDEEPAPGRAASSIIARLFGA